MPIKFRHHYSPHRKSNTSKSIQKLVFGLLMIFLVTTAVRHSRATTINAPTQPSQSATASTSSAPASKSATTNTNDTWKISYFHHDHLGNITAVTDEHGNLLEVKDYLPFGGTNVDEHYGDSTSDYSYNDKEKDDESDLYYYGARYYNQTASTFTSADPVSRFTASEDYIVDPQQWNLYAYARNNPLRFIDPLGLFNAETGTIQKWDTSEIITDGVNKQWGTDYSWDNIVELNPDILGSVVSGSKTLDDIVGQTIIPNFEIPDITVELNKLNIDHAELALRLKFGLLMFAHMFRQGGPWDLKSQPGTFCQSSLTCTNDKSTIHYWFVYLAQKIRGDAPGNIHYGYVGAAMGIQLYTLLSGATVIQNGGNVWKNIKMFLKGEKEYKEFPTVDDAYDQIMIKKGYKLYHKDDELYWKKG